MPASSRLTSAAVETRHHWQRRLRWAGISVWGNAAGKAGVRRAAAAGVWSRRCAGTISRRRFADDLLSFVVTLAPVSTSLACEARQSPRSTHTECTRKCSLQFFKNVISVITCFKNVISVVTVSRLNGLPGQDKSHALTSVLAVKVKGDLLQHIYVSSYTNLRHTHTDRQMLIKTTPCFGNTADMRAISSCHFSIFFEVMFWCYQQNIHK